MTSTSRIHVEVDALVGTLSGGSPVLSYQIDYDKGLGLWTELKGYSLNDASLFAVKD